MIANRIPAGVMDGGTEFFTSGGRAHAFHAGIRMAFAKVPECRKHILRVELMAHPQLDAAMEKIVGSCPEAKLEQYTMCQLGALNENPDIDADGNLSMPEYVPCSKRGACPVEGIGCINILVKEGVFLTKTETEVFKLVNLPDKLIADKLGMTTNTVKVHFKNIRIKSGLLNKIEMAIWATQRGIL